MEINDVTSDSLRVQNETWSRFWQDIARIWVSLPIHVQLEYAKKYPPIDSHAASTS